MIKTYEKNRPISSTKYEKSDPWRGGSIPNRKIPIHGGDDQSNSDEIFKSTQSVLDEVQSLKHRNDEQLHKYNSLEKEFNSLREYINGKNSIQNTLQKALEDFNNYWQGDKKNDEGERHGGKRDEIHQHIEKIDSYWNTRKDEKGNIIREGTEDYIERKKIEIENLLADATSVVLGNGYQDQLEIHGKNAENYAKKFSWFLYICIGGLSIAIALLMFYLPELNNIFDNFQEFYWIIGPPFIAVGGLIIWLGTFLKDKEREERVLKSEYEHKKQFINVFVGYIKEIEKLKVEDIVNTKSALTQLYETMINTAGHNPSLRISTKGSEHLLKSFANNIIPEKGQKNPASKGADAAAEAAKQAAGE